MNPSTDFRISRLAEPLFSTSRLDDLTGWTVRVDCKDEIAAWHASGPWLEKEDCQLLPCLSRNRDPDGGRGAICRAFVLGPVHAGARQPHLALLH